MHEKLTNRTFGEAGERLLNSCPDLADNAQALALLNSILRDGDRCLANLTELRKTIADADVRIDRLSVRLAAAHHDAKVARIAQDEAVERCQAMSHDRARLHEELESKDAAVSALDHRLRMSQHEAEDLRRQANASDTRDRVARSDASPSSTRAGEADAIVSKLRRQVASADSQAASDRAVLALFRSMIAVLAGSGKWWFAFMPEFWVRKIRYRRLKLRGDFDSGSYKKRYPDVARSSMDPLQHYVLHGLDEGRSRV